MMIWLGLGPAWKETLSILSIDAWTYMMSSIEGWCQSRDGVNINLLVHFDVKDINKKQLIFLRQGAGLQMCAPILGSILRNRD